MDKKKMRLFIASFPPPEVCAQIIDFISRGHWPERVRHPQEQNFHLTLAFLGQVESARLAEISALAESYQGQKFLLKFNKVGYWQHNHLAWLGMQNIPRGLLDLENFIVRSLNAAAIPVHEHHTFIPHLTIARDLYHPIQHHPKLTTIEWQVDEFSLVESRPLPHASQYLRLQTWKLK